MPDSPSAGTTKIKNTFIQIYLIVTDFFFNFKEQDKHILQIFCFFFQERERERERESMTHLA